MELSKWVEVKRIPDPDDPLKSTESPDPDGSPKTFNVYESKIVHILYQYGKPMTLAQIMRISGLSWNTIKKYMMNLEDEGFVLSSFTNGKEYWQLNY